MGGRRGQTRGAWRARRGLHMTERKRKRRRASGGRTAACCFAATCCDHIGRFTTILRHFLTSPVELHLHNRVLAPPPPPHHPRTVHRNTALLPFLESGSAPCPRHGSLVRLLLFAALFELVSVVVHAACEFVELRTSLLVRELRALLCCGGEGGVGSQDRAPPSSSRACPELAERPRAGVPCPLRGRQRGHVACVREGRGARRDAPRTVP